MHILPDLHELEEKYPSEQTGVVVVSLHNTIVPYTAVKQPELIFYFLIS